MSSSDYSYDTDSDHDIDPVPKISPLNDDIRLTTIDYCRLAFFIAIIHCANNILQTTWDPKTGNESKYGKRILTSYLRSYKLTKYIHDNKIKTFKDILNLNTSGVAYTSRSGNSVKYYGIILFKIVPDKEDDEGKINFYQPFIKYKNDVVDKRYTDPDASDPPVLSHLVDPLDKREWTGHEIDLSNTSDTNQYYVLLTNIKSQQPNESLTGEGLLVDFPELNKRQTSVIRQVLFRQIIGTNIKKFGHIRSQYIGKRYTDGTVTRIIPPPTLKTVAAVGGVKQQIERKVSSPFFSLFNGDELAGKVTAASATLWVCPICGDPIVPGKKPNMEIDHINNLNVTIMLHQQNKPDGYFMVCSQCNSPFKSDKLLCPTGLSESRMLNIFDGANQEYKELLQHYWNLDSFKLTDSYHYHPGNWTTNTLTKTGAEIRDERWFTTAFNKYKTNPDFYQELVDCFPYSTDSGCFSLDNMEHLYLQRFLIMLNDPNNSALNDSINTLVNNVLNNTKIPKLNDTIQQIAGQVMKPVLNYMDTIVDYLNQVQLLKRHREEDNHNIVRQDSIELTQNTERVVQDLTNVLNENPIENSKEKTKIENIIDAAVKQVRQEYHERGTANNSARIQTALEKSPNKFSASPYTARTTTDVALHQAREIITIMDVKIRQVEKIIEFLDKEIEEMVKIGGETDVLIRKRDDYINFGRKIYKEYSKAFSKLQILEEKAVLARGKTFERNKLGSSQVKRKKRLNMEEVAGASTSYTLPPALGVKDTLREHGDVLSSKLQEKNTRRGGRKRKKTKKRRKKKKTKRKKTRRKRRKKKKKRTRRKK